MISITIHQLYDAFIRAVEHFRDVKYSQEQIVLNVVYPTIGKNFIPDAKLKFKLEGRNVILETKVEIVHIFPKAEMNDDSEIKTFGNGKFYKNNREKINI